MTRVSKIPKVNGKIETSPIKLPYNGNVVMEEHLSFSFSCFDRTYDFFNLGYNSSEGVVSGKWFLDLMDCLKSASSMKICALKKSGHQLHPIDWKKANVNKPTGDEQCEYWQFRINKSKGRVIGILIANIFYVVWLDPHHNLTSSEGYGGIKKHYTPKSLYEEKEEALKHCEDRVSYLEEQLSQLKSPQNQ